MSTFALGLYRLATRVLGPLAEPLLRSRAKKGKEDPSRLGERFGHASATRPDGPLVWMHGASVGESLMLLTVIEALRAERPDLSFLATSGTLTSAKLLAERLPQGAIHQFAPLDRPDIVARFFDAWRPSLCVFAESELWPNQILEAKARGVPLALVNARMTDESARNWSRVQGSARVLLTAFDWIGAADTRTARALTTLSGRPTPLVGNLKTAAGPPEVDHDTLREAAEAVGPRQVWLAASTHAGEEAILIEAHRRLRADPSDRLLILAPRHPERGADVKMLCDAAGLASARRALGAQPEPALAVYIADTLGEMGLWLRLSSAAFIGGSLLPGIGGHNPIEAAVLNCPIVTGPHVANFETLYRALAEAGAADVAADAAGVAAAIRALDAPSDPRRLESARKVAQGDGTVLKTTIEGLRPLLPGPADARA